MKKFICIFCVIFFALSNTISFASNELDNLYENAKFVVQTASGIRESHPHDINITKEAPNYSVRE